MSKFTKKNKEHLDSMVIGQGHTIMAGYIPESVGAQAFSENYYKWKTPTPDTIAQFGFWGGDIDYNTYYPNLDKSELTPRMKSSLNLCSDYFLKRLYLRTGILLTLVRMEYLRLL